MKTFQNKSKFNQDLSRLLELVKTDDFALAIEEKIKKEIDLKNKSKKIKKLFLIVFWNRYTGDIIVKSSNRDEELDYYPFGLDYFSNFSVLFFEHKVLSNFYSTSKTKELEFHPDKKGTSLFSKIKDLAIKHLLLVQKEVMKAIQNDNIDNTLYQLISRGILIPIDFLSVKKLDELYWDNLSFFNKINGYHSNNTMLDWRLTVSFAQQVIDSNFDLIDENYLIHKTFDNFKDLLIEAILFKLKNTEGSFYIKQKLLELLYGLSKSYPEFNIEEEVKEFQNEFYQNEVVIKLNELEKLLLNKDEKIDDNLIDPGEEFIHDILSINSPFWDKKKMDNKLKSDLLDFFNRNKKISFTYYKIFAPSLYEFLKEKELLLESFSELCDLTDSLKIQPEKTIYSPIWSNFNFSAQYYNLGSDLKEFEKNLLKHKVRTTAKVKDDLKLLLQLQSFNFSKAIKDHFQFVIDHLDLVE